MIEGFIQRPEGAAPGAVQPLQLLPAGARHRRRHERAPGQAWRSNPAPIRCSATTRTAGKTPAECFDLEGNPGARPGLADLQAQVPRRQSRQRDGGAAHLRRLRDHRGAFPQALPDRAARHLERAHGAAGGVPRASTSPSAKESSPTSGRSTASSSCRRLLVDSTMVESCEDRRDFWTMLRALAGVGKPEVTREEIEAEVRRDLAGRIGAGAGRPGLRRRALAPARWPRPRRRSGAGACSCRRQPARRRTTWRRGSTAPSAPPATSACGSTARSSPTTPTRRPTSRTRRPAPTRTWSRRRRSARRGSSIPGCRATDRRKTSTKWIARGEKYN